MSDHTRFLATIARNPADMGPRLVYSDWLEERGDPRGEYIRSSIELSLWGSSERPRAYGNWNIDCRNRPDWKGTDDSCTIPPNPWRKHCEYHELRFRCAALLAEYRREWTMAGLPGRFMYTKDGFDYVEIDSPMSVYLGPKFKADFARGFPEVVTCRFQEWSKHHATLCNVMPVREVRITNPVDPKWLLATSAKWNDTGLDFDSAWRSADPIKLLAAEIPGADSERPIRYILLPDRHLTREGQIIHGDGSALPRGIDPRTVFPYRTDAPVGGIP